MIISVGLLPDGTIPNGNPFQSRRWCIMVIRCFFPGIYSDLPFPSVLSTSGGWANR